MDPQQDPAPVSTAGPPCEFTRRQFFVGAAAAPLALKAAAAAATAPLAPLAAAALVRRGTKGAHRYALTFHGAGDPALTREVLAITKALSAPITVFAVGTWVRANPALLTAIAAGRHELANHTQTHPALRRLDRAGVAAEISGCARSLSAATGSIGAYFRPSGTPSPTMMIREEALRGGYATVVGYDVDPRDYQDPGAAAVVARTLAALTDGSIVSLHLGHRGTVDALEAIITGAGVRGLKPVTVSTLLGAKP